MPFHVARAYGLATRPAPTPAAPVSPAAQATRTQSGRNENLSRLIAAVVPGGIDFSSAEPTPSAGSTLAMYRHPADRNAAATGVQAGRVIDVVG